ncbi:MAG TPA: chromosomal replication initiator protein DnaA [Saprospiraceae bacterium]|nr:chromosomal replication initiator protein DnaA [Saprospiraceae bacterium]
MTKDHILTWNDCLEIISKAVNQQSYKTWFEPIKPIKATGEVLTIQVPNRFFYEWLEEHYVSVLKKAIRKVMGENGRLEYQFLIENHRKIGNLANTNGYNQKEEIKNPFVIPGIKKLKIENQLNANYTFSSFVEGDCNRLAKGAGTAISMNPGKTAFNPLVIFGDVGLGKTHLAQAIGNEISTKNSAAQILYVPTEKFTNQVINAIKENSLSDFMHFYQMIDVLIIDDIQFLAKKPKTQEIFFNIFNDLHQNGKQIILTSDRAPKDLDDVESRLISRFKWGLSAELSTPDFEIRKAILQKKIDKESLKLSDEMIDFICYHIKNNIRELEGVLISLIAQSTLNRRRIDIDLVKEVVSQFIGQVNKEVTIENIKKLVADHFRLPLDKLHSKTRKREIVIARQLSMYLAKNYTNNSLKSIGKNFGNRDHSTVIYSLQAVKDMMDTDLLFKDTVVELEKKVLMHLYE